MVIDNLSPCPRMGDGCRIYSGQEPNFYRYWFQHEENEEHRMEVDVAVVCTARTLAQRNRQLMGVVADWVNRVHEYEAR